MSGLVVPLKTEIIKVHQEKKKDLLTGVWMDEWFVFKYYYNFFFGMLGPAACTQRPGGLACRFSKVIKKIIFSDLTHLYSHLLAAPQRAAIIDKSNKAISCSGSIHLQENKYFCLAFSI